MGVQEKNQEEENIEAGETVLLLQKEGKYCYGRSKNSMHDEKQ